MGSAEITEFICLLPPDGKVDKEHTNFIVCDLDTALSENAQYLEEIGESSIIFVLLGLNTLPVSAFSFRQSSRPSGKTSRWRIFRWLGLDCRAGETTSEEFSVRSHHHTKQILRRS
jgi:hypothetical protein